MSLPVDADRTLAPESPWDETMLPFTERLGSDNRGGQGGFRETLPTNKID